MSTERTDSISYRPTYRLADLPEVDIPPEVAKQLAERINARIEAQLMALLHYPLPRAKPWTVAIRCDVA